MWSWNSRSRIEDLNFGERNYEEQETNKIARNYAIIAWFDVMGKQSGKKKKELAYIKKQRKKEKAECCLMTWSYCY